MQYARSIISAGSRSGTWKTVNRGLARIRRDAPKRPTPEMLEAYSKAAAMPNPHEGFVNQADKVMKEMRAKVKETTDRHSSTFIKEGDIEENNSWNWVPPREEGREDDEVIPIKRGVLLTTEEIRDALVAQGGIDVRIIEMRQPLDTITHLVITTGRSLKHLRKMSDSIVQALKSRRLKQCVGRQGAEGAKDDDWLCVDCYDTVAHFMMPITRQAVDLETHWTTEWPVLTFSDNEKVMDENFEKILDLYPIPENYNVARDDEKVEVTKKKKTTVRRL